MKSGIFPSFVIILCHTTLIIKSGLFLFCLLNLFKNRQVCIFFRYCFRFIFIPLIFFYFFLIIFSLLFLLRLVPLFCFIFLDIGGYITCKAVFILSLLYISIFIS